MKVCLKAAAVTQQDSYFTVQTDSVPIRIWFLTDQILRIRAGFDGDFLEESYSLVTTAWEDRMDKFMKDYRKRIAPAQATVTDGEDKAVLQGKELKVVVEKDPFRICVYDKDGTQIHADIVDLATTGGSIPARSALKIVSMALERRAENLTKPRNLWE